MVMDMQPSVNQPLLGKRILVTRPRDQSDAFEALLHERGAVPIAVPLIHVEESPEPARLLAAVEAASTYDWIVFTSANGVDAFFRAAAKSLVKKVQFGNARICVVGPATRDALNKYGVAADAMPEEFRGEAVAELILQQTPGVKNARVLLARAEVARDFVPEALRAAGMHVDIVAAYRTETLDDAAALQQLRAAYAEGIDVATFTSPSTFNVFARAAASAAELRNSALAAIGPVTADAMTKAAMPPAIVARDYTVRGLVSALETYFTEKRS